LTPAFDPSGRRRPWSSWQVRLSVAAWPRRRQPAARRRSRRHGHSLEPRRNILDHIRLRPSRPTAHHRRVAPFPSRPRLHPGLL